MKPIKNRNFKKKTTAILSVVIAVAILATGTFAWQAIRHALNEATNFPAESELHDDYDPDTGEKNIYVENTGKADIFVRLRLDEFLTLTAHDTSGISDFTADPEADNYWDFWTSHSPLDGDCAICDELSKDEGVNYHSIDGEGKGFEWTFAEKGSTKTYLHAKHMTDEHKFPGYVQDTTVYPNAAYPAGSEELGETLPTDLITMAAYKALANPEDYLGWIYDTDGWVYWSQALPKDTATGVLLEKIGFDSMTDEEYYYAINAVMEVVDIKDLNNMWLLSSNDSLSDDAKAIFAKYKYEINKTGLENAIAEAGSLDTTGVEQGLLDDLNNALTNGTTALGNEDATQQEIDDAEKAIRDAIKAIEDSKIPPVEEKLKLKNDIKEITVADNASTGALVARVTSDDGVRVTYFSDFDGDKAYNKVALSDIFENTAAPIETTIISATIKSGSSFNGKPADYTGDIVKDDTLLLIKVLPQWQQMWDVYSETGNLADYALDIVVTFTQNGMTSDEFTIHAPFIPALVD